MPNPKPAGGAEGTERVAMPTITVFSSDLITEIPRPDRA